MTDREYRKLEFTRGSVYWANLNKYRQSSVQSGTRPVVIVSSLQGNLSSDVVMVAPLSTRIKPLLINADIKFMIDDRPSQVLCNQIQTVPKSALFNYIGELPARDMNEVESCILLSLGITSLTVKATKASQEALSKQAEDKKALDDLIPRAQQLIAELTEIVKRQEALKPAGKKKVTGEVKKKTYVRRTPEEIEEFIKDWEDPTANREKLVSYYKFSSYATAYNFYYVYKKKKEARTDD